MLNLSQDETSELRRALAGAATELEPTPSLDGLLSRWGSLVNEIERGYELSAYDYTNDLGVRDRLERILISLTPSLRAKVTQLVTPLDERFTKATQEVPRPISGGRFRWWRRIPRRRSHEFDETI